ncbi:hypothetical protein A9Q81_15570 [Gammaproteobacteria bacterium 42_54_T18]|nr:hypothetical protein A9Q81_15570 [Gammaproteobacteria bacterium 42_54_T18]
MIFFRLLNDQFTSISKKTIQSIIVLLLFSLMPIFYGNFDNSMVNYYYALLNFLVILCALTFSGKLRITLNTIILTSVFIAVISIEVSGGMLSNGAFHSILATNTNEVREYFSLIDVGSFSVTIIISLLCIILFTKSVISPHKLILWPIYILTITLVFGYPAFRYLVDENYARDAKRDAFSILYVIPSMPSYNLYLTAALALHERHLSQESYGNSLPPHIDKLPVLSDENGDIILILGESSRQGSYSIYEEIINSTPNLKTRLKESEHFYRINNVYAPAPNTRESVARSLTFATSSTFLHDGLPFKTLLSSMSEAGYETIWITTQDLYTRWDTFSAKVANSADRVILKSNNGTAWTDNIAAKIAVKELKKPQKSFIVLHLWGEHSDYRIRNGIPIPQKSVEAIEQQIAKDQSIDSDKLHYLASIHHTDSILESIFSYIENANPNDLAIYFPDHGEVIGKGHGLIPIHLESELSIPFVSQGNKSRILSKEISKFRDKKFGIFNTSYFPEVLINTLGGIAGVPKESHNLTYFSIQGSPIIVEYNDYINRT